MAKLKIRVHEAKASDFGPIFFVSDIDGNQQDYDHDTYRGAVSAAKRLSLENPDTPYTIELAINSPVILNGKLLSREEYEALHPED